jgi:aspartyl-tRNA(Asn)/glutamyl-tRNA(Gln) amidotransferase subunit A
VREPPVSQELCALGVRELGTLYRQRRLSPVEVVQATVARIRKVDSDVNAYCAVMEESAMLAARAAEAQLMAGIDLGPLHGVPTSIKDNIHVRGTRTTAGSKSLSGAPLEDADAAVVSRLRQAGAIVIGRVNCDEFATGNPEPGDLKLVQNPRKWGHRTGGSSSGSAAAVASGTSVLSIGTDTGGSVRHPASLCGVVGLRPTHGLVSMRGVIPFSEAMDVAGPLARSTADIGAGLIAMAGNEPDDPYSILAPQPKLWDGTLSGLRMGFPTNPMYRRGQSEVMVHLDIAKAALVDLGMTPKELDLPRAEETIDVSTTLMLPDLVESVMKHAPAGSVFGRDLSRRLQQAREVGISRYVRAQTARTELRQDWLRVFQAIDVLVLPANLAAAPRHEDQSIAIEGQETEFRIVTSGTNRAASLTGFPALTLPIGATSDGLPVGLQLVGRPLSEALLLAVGHALEGAVGNLPEAFGIDPVGVPRN